MRFEVVLVWCRLKICLYFSLLNNKGDVMDSHSALSSQCGSAGCFFSDENFKTSFCKTIVNTVVKLKIYPNSTRRDKIEDIAFRIYEILFSATEKDNDRVVKNLKMRKIGIVARFGVDLYLIQTKIKIGGGKDKTAYNALIIKFIREEPLLKFAVDILALVENRNILSAIDEDNLATCFESSHIIKKSIENFFLNNKFYSVAEKLLFDLGKVTSCAVNMSYVHKIYVLKGAAKGLAEIHRKGYMHRDIKPENIAISKNKKGVVIDLGFTIKRDASHTIDFTPIYAPPELVIPFAAPIRPNEDPSDYWYLNQQTPAGDLWAFGMTVFEVTHPKHEEPYFVRKALTFEEINMAYNGVKLTDRSVFLSKLFEERPAQSSHEILNQALITKLLSIEPSNRGTAEELYQDLKQIYKEVANLP